MRDKMHAFCGALQLEWISGGRYKNAFKPETGRGAIAYDDSAYEAEVGAFLGAFRVDLEWGHFEVAARVWVEI